MKRVLQLSLSLFCILYGVNVRSQSSTAEQVANRIAQKMKDTLSLSDTQQQQVYDINMQLYNEKTAVRSQYSGSDSLGYYMQRVENKRDSLYRTILSIEKFELYIQKKRTLVSNN